MVESIKKKMLVIESLVKGTIRSGPFLSVLAVEYMVSKETLGLTNNEYFHFKYYIIIAISVSVFFPYSFFEYNFSFK